VAESFNCQACGGQSPAEAKFCIHCGGRLAARCTSCGAAVAVGARFCSECGAAMVAIGIGVPWPATSTMEADGERRQLTVLFCDIVNSTELSYVLDPEELRTILRTYQEACATAVAKFEGHLAKYLGDGIMAYFGYPRAHDDDARRAVLAASDIIAAVRGISREQRSRTHREIKVRVGIHTGLVVTGELGGGAVREQHGVVGQTPNIAARIQNLAKPNSIVVSAQTRALLQETFEVRALGRIPMKGLPQAFELFQVGERQVPSAMLARQPVELAGRGKERELLLDRWALAKSGSGQAVLVAGEAGIGKSTLITSVHQGIEAQSGAVLPIQCSPFFRNTPFYPVVELVTRMLAFGPGDGPVRHIEKIRTSLATIGIAAEGTVGLVAQLLDLPSDDPRHAPDPDPARRRRAIMETLAAWLLAGTSQAPKLLIFEDVIGPTAQRSS